MKIVINRCYGGFGLSPQALLWLWERGEKSIGELASSWYSSKRQLQTDLKKYRNYKIDGKTNLFLTTFSPDEKYVLSDDGLERDNPMLVACVEELGANASAYLANLQVVTIPDGTDWEIADYDGMERVVEKHRSWS